MYANSQGLAPKGGAISYIEMHHIDAGNFGNSAHSSCSGLQKGIHVPQKQLEPWTPLP